MSSALHHFDVIVIGVGSMGSAACYYLAKQGARVLGLEQFSIPNELGSHNGQSRLIRKAYYEHAGYVPLLQRAYSNWKQLEAVSGGQVYFETGLLYAGNATHPVMKGVRAAASQYHIPLEELSSGMMQRRFSQFCLDSATDKIFEPEAGFLLPGKAIELYAKQAIACGAIIKINSIVQSWEQSGKQVKVISGGEVYIADKLVITAGARAASLLPSLAGSLTVTRQTLGWVAVNSPELFMHGKMPCWVIAEDGVPGIYYGFPQLPAHGVDGPVGFKLAHHVAGEITSADAVNRNVTQQDEEALVAIMQRYFPGEFKSLVAVKTCLYTNTPDENFIIDYLPGNDRVIVAAGFSGHGFKFASAIGEILSDLALTGKTDFDLEFLEADRFAK